MLTEVAGHYVYRYPTCALWVKPWLLPVRGVTCYVHQIRSLVSVSTNKNRTDIYCAARIYCTFSET